MNTPLRCGTGVASTATRPGAPPPASSWIMLGSLVSQSVCGGAASICDLSSASASAGNTSYATADVLLNCWRSLCGCSIPPRFVGSAPGKNAAAVEYGISWICTPVGGAAPSIGASSVLKPARSAGGAGVSTPNSGETAITATPQKDENT